MPAFPLLCTNCPAYMHLNIKYCPSHSAKKPFQKEEALAILKNLRAKRPVFRIIQDI